MADAERSSGLEGTAARNVAAAVEPIEYRAICKLAHPVFRPNLIGCARFALTKFIDVTVTITDAVFMAWLTVCLPEA